MVVIRNLVTFTMQGNMEQRYDIKFYVKLNKSATGTFVSLTESYGDVTLTRTMVLSGTKFSKTAEKMLKTPLFRKTKFVNKCSKCGSGASCDGERPPIECQNDCRRNG